MAARILDGKALAKRHNAVTKQRIEGHLDAAGRSPRLDVLLFGDDDASAIYVRNKKRTGERIGVETHIHTFPGSPDINTPERIARELAAVEAEPGVDGVVLQLPLPGHADARPLLALMDPDRDVDGFHPLNMGRLLCGMDSGFIPATPLGILWVLDEAGCALRGADVTIVSHSNLIGKPLAAALLARDATVCVTHVHTRDLAAHTRHADVLVTAAGVPGLITADLVKPGAVVIDAATVLGADGVLRGDCAFDDVSTKASAITPVPGGVGPVTVSALFHNTVEAWRRRTI